MATFDILQAFSEEVGSRRAGSEGEKKAQHWLQEQCQRLDLSTTLDEFAYIGLEWYRPLVRLVSLVWLLLSVWLMVGGRPLLGLGLLTLQFLYFSTVHKQLEVRLARAKSHNVIAGLRRSLPDYIADPEKGPAVLVCAHYDSPRNFPGWSGYLRRAIRYIGPLAILALVVYVLSLIGGLAGQWLQLNWLVALSNLVGWLALIFIIPFLLLGLVGTVVTLLGSKSDSPGVDDNGSGTAVVAEVAKRMQSDPPSNLEVFFAWWGAEELGLFGSRQFVRRFHRQLDKERFHLLNIDCVGVGERLTVQTGKGTFRRQLTDAETVERLERLAAGLGIKTVRYWESIISGGSSDHAAWMERGFSHAVTLLRENMGHLTWPSRLVALLFRIPDANQLELDHIHTPEDTLGLINPHYLDQTAALAESYIREVEQAYRAVS